MSRLILLVLLALGGCEIDRTAPRSHIVVVDTSSYQPPWIVAPIGSPMPMATAYHSRF